MPEALTTGPRGRQLRVGHLTTVDMSLLLLLRTELEVDVAHGFDVYGLSAPGEHAAALAALGVKHVPLPSLTRSWHPRQDLAAGLELVAALRRLRLDVLHTHNPKTGVLGRLLGRTVGVPVIVNTCHGLWVTAQDSWLRRFLVIGAESLAAQASDAELFQNDSDRKSLRWVVPAWRSRVVGNGIDLDRFQRDDLARATLRSEWGVAEDELLVGGVGRRVAEKGIAEFGALARALDGRARFVWVGPDDAAKADAATIPEPGVTFAGARVDMVAVYSAFDVFVLPSYREGFSRSAMEAASCGLPMVLSDVRGCREVGRHGEELLLTPVRDVAALVQAVGALVADADLRQRLGAAARRRALAAFDQRAVAETSVATYVAVARRRGLDWVL